MTINSQACLNWVKIQETIEAVYSFGKSRLCQLQLFKMEEDLFCSIKSKFSPYFTFHFLQVVLRVKPLYSNIAVKTTKKEFYYSNQ